MKLHTIALATLLAAGATTSAHAGGLDFYFTINAPYFENFTYEGEEQVKGEIYDLTLGGYSSPSDIDVTYNPGDAGTGLLAEEGYQGSGTFDVQLVNNVPTIVGTSSNGVSWLMIIDGGDITNSSVLSFNSGGNGSNGSSETTSIVVPGLFSETFTSTVTNYGGFGGATYAYATGYTPPPPGSPGNTVPEPSQYGLFVALAVAGLVFLRRFSGKIA